MEKGKFGEDVIETPLNVQCGELEAVNCIDESWFKDLSLIHATTYVKCYSCTSRNDISCG